MMKKKLILSLLFGIILLSLVSASDSGNSTCTDPIIIGDGLEFNSLNNCPPTCQTDITTIDGTVYLQGGNPNDNPISGANVVTLCNGFSINTITDSAGHYAIFYNASECDLGDNVTVSAFKDDLVGEENGTIAFSFTLPLQCSSKINVGVVDVPLVPEFGFLLAGLTVLASLGAFFIIRNK